MANAPCGSNCPFRTTPLHWLVLGALIALAALVRFHLIDRNPMYLDEFWSVDISLCRADAALAMPQNVLIVSPPAMGLAGAPPWWHVWAGMKSSIHPPLYHVLLRLWINAFGDSDRVTRALSALLSLSAIAALFDLMRRAHGPWPALIGAAMMSLAWSQIHFAQETRSYPAMIFFVLMTARALIIMEQRGVNLPRLAGFGIMFFAAALTHYFATGALLGITLCALFRQGRRGGRALAYTLIIVAAILVVTWGALFMGTARGGRHARR